MQKQLPAMLPEMLDFMRQVELNRTIEGNYPLAKLERLAETLLHNEGYVSAKLEFCHSAGFACLKAKASAKLLVKCQRCLKPMETEVTGSFKFALVNSEEDFDLLPEEFEPYLLEGSEQSIIDLIEDELLLSFPMVTVHEDACSDFMTSQAKAIKATKEASHPFAALKALKDDIKQ
ncbi:MAG: hypothetical protein GQ573_01110 [Gammaproteobacteria bacterium]|jgi:uncharacterized protein|nr:hypothetical protein [Gammaproteobacteria bacterium]